MVVVVVVAVEVVVLYLYCIVVVVVGNRCYRGVMAGTSVTPYMLRK